MTHSLVKYVSVFCMLGAVLVLWAQNRLQSPGVTFSNEAVAADFVGPPNSISSQKQSFLQNPTARVVARGWEREEW